VKSTDNPSEQGQYRLDSQVGYLLRLASQRHWNIFQTHTVNDLTPMQFSALIRISEVGACSQNHLGRLASMDVATIKGVIGRLQRKGLVVLNADPNDKRRTIISLSPDGAALIGQLHDVGQKISAETLGPLTENEKARLLKLLKKMT